MDRTDLQPGDEVRVVVKHPNADEDKDPVTQIEGKIGFILFEEDYQPTFGELIVARVVDETEGYFNLVATGTPEATDD